MHVKSQDVEALTAVVQDAAQGLSPRALSVLVSHPDAVRSALAVAADALSAKDADVEGVEIVEGAEPRLVHAGEAGRRIAARARPGKKEDLLTSDELAARAGLKTRQSVHDWLKKGKIVGWQGGKRGYVFPADQLDGRGRPVKGMDRITPCFEDGYAAWIWLKTPLGALMGAMPITRLRKGEVDLVAAAAEGDAQGDFA